MKFFLLVPLLMLLLSSCKDEQIIPLEIVQASNNLSGRDTVLAGHPLGVRLVVALPSSCVEFRNVTLRPDSNSYGGTLNADGPIAGGICTQELRYYETFRTLTLADTGTYYLRTAYPTARVLDTIIVR